MPIIGKQLLCSTQVNYFNQFVGFDGGRLYQNFASLKALVASSQLARPYCDCFAEPEEDGKGTILWWTEPWNDSPLSYMQLQADERVKYEVIYNETIQAFEDAIKTIKQPKYVMLMKAVVGTLTRDNAFCFDDRIVFVAWGMHIDNMKVKTVGEIIVPIETTTISHRCRVEFICENGHLKDKTQAIQYVDNNTAFPQEKVPVIIPDEGLDEIEWIPENPMGYIVTKKMQFQAICKKKEQVLVNDFDTDNPDLSPDSDPDPQPLEPPHKQEYHNCTFDSDGRGTIEGSTTLSVKDGECVKDSDIPKVNADNGYEFVGWEPDIKTNIKEPTQFKAQYKTVKVPWLRRFGIWLAGLFSSIWIGIKSFFQWLWSYWWRILLFLLLLLLLLFLLRNCHGCSRGIVPPGADLVDEVGDPNVGSGGIYNPGDPYTPNPTDGAYEGILPPQEGVLPPVGDDVVEQPGGPTIVANQINILMENEDRHIGDLAKRFKELYPGEEYKVTYYDNVTKRMNVTVPIPERSKIKAELPQQVLPEFTIFVFDEAMFEGAYVPSDPDFNTRKSWYLERINVLKAWDMTKGDPSVTVAIVDNGFSLKHPEFRGRICGPYNVWRHSNKIDAHEEDHGTHVAGIALAAMDNGKGCCGIAPQCSFMPVQVADDKDRMTTTSILDGILYSIYQGADVVNVSLGQNLNGLDAYPESAQQELIDNHFKEEERLWNKVMQIADKHKCIVVFAAGNDNVLAGIDPQQRSQDCIVVSAVNRKNQSVLKADFSNYGSYSTISAPGVDIYSCYKNGFCVESGTSMAAPVVTGVIALMKSLNRNLSVQEVRCILQTTGNISTDNIGPLIQAYEALQKVQSGETCVADDTTRVEDVVLHHGDVEISLTWENCNDLDLICKDPAGETIYYRHKQSQSNGTLDVDMNCRPPYSVTPIEHIYWPVGGAPRGSYQVSVMYYGRHDANAQETPFQVKVKANGMERTYSGVMTVPDTARSKQVCIFTVD